MPKPRSRRRKPILKPGRRRATPGPTPPGSSLRDYLARQEKGRLVEIILDQATKDDRFLRRLSVEAAAGKGGRTDVAAIRRSLAAAIETDDFISYREVFDYAGEVDRLVDLLQGLLKQGQAGDVIEAAEYGIQLLDEAIHEIDDSGGDVSSVMDRLQDLHLAACRKARPDPEALARRLFTLELGSGLTFHRAAETYKGVLGKKGLAAYRQLAESEWKKLPALKPGAARDYDFNRSRLKHILESVSEASGDVEALVAVKARDLSSASDYLAIAEICQEAGRRDQAIEWAEKGLRASPKQADPRLRAFLASRYRTRKRHAEAMELLWANFTDQPSVATYRGLKPSGRSADWPAWRQKALGHLRDLAAKAGQRRGSFAGHTFWGAASRLVEILLWEKKDDDAWREAQRFGCSEELWLELAKRRAESHPEDALPIYQRAVEVDLRVSGGAGYERATRRLTAIRGLMEGMGKSKEFVSYLGTIRLTHKPKRNFIKLLDRGGLK